MLQHETINNFESQFGDEINESFTIAYSLIKDNLAKYNRNELEHKYKAIILLSDGLTTLTLIFHSSLLGYCFENTALLRYYIENLGISYGIFTNKKLYNDWKENPKNEYANKFTKAGLKILFNSYPQLEELWKRFSQISHIYYKTIGTSLLSKNTITIGGAITENRKGIIDMNIKSAQALLQLTSVIFDKEFGLNIE